MCIVDFAKKYALMSWLTTCTFNLGEKICAFIPGEKICTFGVVKKICTLRSGGLAPQPQHAAGSRKQGIGTGIGLEPAAGQHPAPTTALLVINIINR